MRAEEQVGAIAQRLPDLRAERDRAGDVRHRRHVAGADRVGAGGIELHRGEAARDVARGGLGRHVRIDPEAACILAGLGIEVGIGAQAFVHPAAEQRPDRAAAGLAEDVPAGDFEPREGAHHGRVGALGEARGIGAAEHQLDVLGVFARHVPRKDILDDGLHRLRADRGGVALAVADYAVIGGELREDPVAPAPARRRRRDDEDLQVLQAHRRSP